MKKLSYRLFLYQPAASAVTLENSSAYFLGELYADNVEVNIKLQDVSTISFTLPEFINGVANPRINEILDNYVIELWYGKIDTETFEKIRFIIYKTPQEFAEEKYLYRYSGYSLESLLEFKSLVNWLGVPIKDFYRIISYNNTASPSHAFTETGQSNLTITTNTATNPKNYIKVAPSTATVSPLDVFIFETRKNLQDDVTSRASLISYESSSANPYNDDGFKPGYYYLENGIDGYVDWIYIAIPDNITAFNGLSTSNRLFSYHLYDNPTSRFYAFGVNTTTNGQNDFYLGLVANESTIAGTSTYNGYTYKSEQENYKNGLSIEQLMIGEQDPSGTTPLEDGILYNTGFTLGTIHEDLVGQYRSNLEFNNLTRYQAIKQIAETFDSIPVFDTINNTVSFYPEILEDGSTDPWTNNGLILRYGGYLKSLQKDIDSSKLITVVEGIGKDNLPISLINPTSKNYWEDYSYFTDEYHIFDDTGFTIVYDETKGLDITYPSGTRQSKWMPAAQAQAIAEWQYTRDYFHNLMLGEVSPINAAHNKYEGLYLDRLEAIKTYVKLQTEVEQKEAVKFKYFTLKEHYIQQNKNSPGTYDDKEVEYTNKYNEASFQVGNARRRLNKIYNLIYGRTQDGSTSFIFKANAITTNGSAEIILTAPNFNLSVGIAVSGSGIPGGATITKIENGLRFTISANATATVNINTPVELTFTESLSESYGYKITEVTTILDKSNWLIDEDLLKSFQREAVVNDSKIDDEFELLKSVIKHINENKLPKVTIQADVADILAAEESYQDWNKVKVGEKINIYLPELDVDQESLVREISINFESNTLGFVISTVRNYNRNILTSAFKIVRDLKNSDSNFNAYIYDKIRYAAYEQVPQQENDAESGNNPTNTGPEDENGNTPQSNGEGSETPPVDDDTIEETTESFEYLLTNGVVVNNGKVLSFKQYTPVAQDPYTIEAEISAENGLEIRKVTGSAEDGDLDVVKQVYINDGNAVFSGFVSVGQTTVGYDNTGVFLGVESNDPKVSFKSDSTTFLKYDPSATYDLEVAGNAKIGPLFVGNTGSSVTTLNSASGLTYYAGETLQLTNSNSNVVTFNLTDTSGQEITGGTVSLTFTGTDIRAVISLYDGLNGAGNLLQTFETGDLSLTGGSGGFLFSSNVRNVKSIVVSVDSNNISSTWTLPIANINITAYKPSIQINNFTVNSAGEITTNKLTVNTSTTAARDNMVIQPYPVGSTFKSMLLTTPIAGLTLNRTIRFPDATGTVALLESNQTFTGNIIISGNLTVNGTTTTLNTENLNVEDKNIILGNVATPTDTTADGGGITLKGATDKTIIWYNDIDAWEFNQSIELVSSSISLDAGQSLRLSGFSDATHRIYHDASTDYDVIDYSTGVQFRHFSLGNQITIQGSTGNVGIGTSSNPTEKLEVNGNIKHTGLVMSSGTNVDQLQTTTFTSALTTSWTDVTGVSGTYLATGSYIVQIESNGEYYTGNMTWFSGTTTSTVADEIVLHRAGPAASAARIYARVIRTSSSPSTLKLQVSASTSVSSHTLTFKFRRTI